MRKQATRKRRDEIEKWKLASTSFLTMRFESYLRFQMQMPNENLTFEEPLAPANLTELRFAPFWQSPFVLSKSSPEVVPGEAAFIGGTICDASAATENSKTLKNNQYQEIQAKRKENFKTTTLNRIAQFLKQGISKNLPDGFGLNSFRW